MESYSVHFYYSTENNYTMYNMKQLFKNSCILFYKYETYDFFFGLHKII